MKASKFQNDLFNSSMIEEKINIHIWNEYKATITIHYVASGWRFHISKKHYSMYIHVLFILNIYFT